MIAMRPIPHVLSGCLLLVLGAPAGGQGLDNVVSFNGGTNVSNDTGLTSEYSVAADMNLIVVAWGDSTTSTIKLGRSTNGGLSFQTSTVPGSAGHFDPEVAIDGTNFYLFTRQGTGASSVVGVFRSMDGGQTFGPPAALPPGAATSVNDPVATVHQGRVFVVYGAFAPAFTGPEVFLNFSDDGVVWLPVPINVSQSAAVQSRNPSLAAAAGKVFVVHRENNLLRQQIYDLNGAPLQAARTIATYTNPGISIRTSIAVSEAGLMTGILFNDLRAPFSQSDVFLTRSTDGGMTYSGEVNLTQNNTVSRPGDVRYNGPKLLVTWEDNVGGVPEIFARCFDTLEGSSGAPVMASGTPGTSSGGPRMVLTGCEAVVAFLETTSTPAGTTNDVHAMFAPLCGALSQVGSGGCAGSQPAPAWSSTGNLCGTFQIVLTWLPNTAGFLGVSLGLAPAPLMIGPCPIDLDLATLVVIPIQTDASGDFSLQIGGPLMISELEAAALFGDPLGPNGFVTSRTIRFWSLN